AAPARVFQHHLANLERQITDGDEVVVRFSREADHVVELEVLEAARKNQLGTVQNLVVRDRLVSHASKNIRAGLRRDGHRSLSALAQKADDGFGEIVE